jgi:hypothetical protein
MFNEVIPIVHLSFQVDKIIDPIIFINNVYYHTRSLWDSYKQNIERLKHYDKGIALVSFTDENCANEDSNAKSHNIMSYISLETESGCSVIQAMFQIDYKIEVNKNTQLVLAKKFDDWGMMFKKVIGDS